MRPKNLKFPFSWKERRPAFQEGVLFVPQFYDKHEEWSRDVFPSDLRVEYCSGNGDWVLAKAQENPDQVWVAVEKQFERVRKIWSKMRNRAVENLIIICGEAQPFTKYYLPDGCVREMYVNFPDPWPKAKHAKHRLIQAPFIEEVERVVAVGGTATLVTDDEPYHLQMAEVMERDGWGRLQCPETIETYGSSWFASLWKNLGRSFHFLQYEKTGLSK